MAEMTSLPAVASNFLYECKKCGEERYHKVLAHPTAASAKLECEVCKAKRTVRVTKPKKAGAKTGAKRTKKEPVQNSIEIFDEWKEKVDIGSPASYTMGASFSKLTAINHPKFGVGIITESFPQKIHVIFQDGERDLVHNRK